MTSWRLGPYRAVGHRFVVEGNDAEQIRLRVDHALAPLADLTNGPTRAYHVIDRGSDASDRFALDFEGRPVYATPSPYYLAAHVVWHVNQEMVRVDRGAHLLLHASAAERDGVTVVMPAPMESGKTTTVAGLLRAGYRYVTDETVVLDREGLAITPYPKALALDAGSVSVLGGVPLPDYRHADTDSQQHVAWWSLGSPGVVGRTSPSLLVFPAYRPGSMTGVEQVTAGEAAMLLAASTFRFRERPRRNLECIARLAESVPAHRLTIGDLDEAVAAVNDLVEALSPLRRSA